MSPPHHQPSILFWNTKPFLKISKNISDWYNHSGWLCLLVWCHFMFTYPHRQTISRPFLDLAKTLHPIHTQLLMANNQTPQDKTIPWSAWLQRGIQRGTLICIYRGAWNVCEYKPVRTRTIVNRVNQALSFSFTCFTWGGWYPIWLMCQSRNCGLCQWLFV